LMACDATNGDTTKKIDVAAVGGQAAKTAFSSSGQIGGTDSGHMNMGTAEAEAAAGSTPFGYPGTDAFTSALPGDSSASVDSTAGTVTFEYTGADVGIAATGFSAYVCAEINPGNAVVIDDTTTAIVTTFVRGDVESTSASCDLLPLRYNGSVVEVYHVNPA